MLDAMVQKALMDSAKRLIDEMGIEHLCSRIMELPDEISARNGRIVETQKEIVGLEIQLVNATGEADNIKAVVVAEVATETNGDGIKPRFGNDKLRDAEATKRLNANAEYRIAKSTVDDLKGQISGLGFDVHGLRHEIGKLEAQMANYRVVISARAAQIKALFGGV
jgi:predicted  nucleic acid-binding Zn-ribbon protein